MTDFTKQLTDALMEYSKTCEQDVQKVIDDVAKEAKKRLVKTSPKGKRKKYYKGWKLTIEPRSGRYVVHIHQKKPEYRLAHLLEHGHKTGLKDGKYGWKAYTAPHVHIAKVEKWAIKEVEERIREVLSK